MVSFVTKARKSALKTQEEFAELLGTSVVTLGKWENNPDEWFTPNKLKVYYDNVGADGKGYIRQYVASFFTPGK